MRTVYIYCDEGTSAESVNGWVCVLKWTLRHPSSLIRKVKAENLLHSLEAQAPSKTALIVPGGADLPYVKLLDKRHIAKVRAVVSQGGSYIGVCAGAYFASCACIFERDDDRLRVVGPRALSLFPHPAIGAVRENFSYQSEAGATTEYLECEWKGTKFQANLYCNGGPAWNVEADDRTIIIARYSDAVLERHGVKNRSPVAALRYSFGIEGNVVLCGVHPELPCTSKNGKKHWDQESMEPGRARFIRSIAKAAGLSGAVAKAKLHL